MGSMMYLGMYTPTILAEEPVALNERWSAVADATITTLYRTLS